MDLAALMEAIFCMMQSCPHSYGKCAGRKAFPMNLLVQVKNGAVLGDDQVRALTDAAWQVAACAGRGRDACCVPELMGPLVLKLCGALSVDGAALTRADDLYRWWVPDAANNAVAATRAALAADG